MTHEKGIQQDDMETYEINSTIAIDRPTNGIEAELGQEASPTPLFATVNKREVRKTRNDDDRANLADARRRIQVMNQSDNMAQAPTSLERGQAEIGGLIDWTVDPDFEEEPLTLPGQLAKGVNGIKAVASDLKAMVLGKTETRPIRETVREPVPVAPEAPAWEKPVRAIERDAEKFGIVDTLQKPTSRRRAVTFTDNKAQEVVNNMGAVEGAHVLPAKQLQRAAVQLARELGVDMPRETGRNTPEFKALDTTVKALTPEAVIEMSGKFVTGKLARNPEMFQLAPAVLSVAAEHNVVQQTAKNIREADPIKQQLLMDYALAHMSTAMPGATTEQKGRNQITRATQDIIGSIAQVGGRNGTAREINPVAVYDVMRRQAQETDPYRRMAMTAVNRALMQHVGHDIETQDKNPDFNKSVATAYEIGRMFAAPEVPYIVPVTRGLLRTGIGAGQDLTFTQAPPFSKLYTPGQTHALTRHIAVLGQPSMAMALDPKTRQATESQLTPEAVQLAQRAEGYMTRHLGAGINNRVTAPAKDAAVIPPSLQRVANGFNSYVVRLANLTSWAPASDALESMTRQDSNTAFVRTVDRTLELADAINHGTHRQQEADSHVATLVKDVLDISALDTVPKLNSEAGVLAGTAMAAASLDHLKATGSPDVAASTVRAFIDPLTTLASRRPQVAVLQDERVQAILEDNLRTSMNSPQADAVWRDYRGAVQTMAKHVINRYTSEDEARRDEGPVDQGLVHLVKAVPSGSTVDRESATMTFVVNERNGSAQVSFVPLHQEISQRQQRLQQGAPAEVAAITGEIQDLEAELARQQALQILNNDGTGVKSLTQVGSTREQVALAVAKALVEKVYATVATANKIQATANVNMLMQSQTAMAANRGPDRAQQANKQGALGRASNASEVADEVQARELRAVPSILKTAREVLQTVNGELQIDMAGLYEFGLPGTDNKPQPVVIKI